MFEFNNLSSKAINAKRGHVDANELDESHDD